MSRSSCWSGSARSTWWPRGRTKRAPSRKALPSPATIWPTCSNIPKHPWSSPNATGRLLPICRRASCWADISSGRMSAWRCDSPKRSACSVATSTAVRSSAAWRGAPISGGSTARRCPANLPSSNSSTRPPKPISRGPIPISSPMPATNCARRWLRSSAMSKRCARMSIISIRAWRTSSSARSSARRNACRTW